jgi:lipopolysaccharide/colanic/teichoic acid biosynthesis glycosyltransferase/NDP-sugar pyrophosphorylase family protein
MNSLPKTAVLLAGGPASSKGFLGVPLKPLLPIANRPLVEYVASVFMTAGVEHLIISLHASATEGRERLARHVRNSSLHVELIAQETTPGTAGSLKEIQDRLRGGPFWVVSGDLFFNVDLREFVAFHQEHGSLATVGAINIPPSPWELEKVEVDADRRVKAIHRLHPMENKRSTLRPAGLYLFEPEVLDLIPTDRYFDLQEQLFPLLTERDTPAIVWRIEGYCRRISGPPDYLSANRDVLLKQAGNDERQFLPPPAPLELQQSEIAPTAVFLDPVVIGTASRIGARAMLIGPTVVGNSCEVAEGAVLNECVVMPYAKIGQGARLDRCIVSEGVEVKAGAMLRETVVMEEPENIMDMAAPPGPHVPLTADGAGAQPLAGWHLRVRQFYLSGKRLVDILVSAVALIVLSPLMGLVALAVKLDSPGEIIFRQTRCGRGGRPFSMYKFRSMVANAEEIKKTLVSVNEVDGPMFKMTSDPRVTRVGRFLRATNLDEIPQLWNILRGDMSLVGPRPLSMDEMRYNPQWRDLRLSVPPGLTGLWQVEGHSKTAFADWITYDIHYVRNMSPWLDLKIIFRTLFRRFGSGNGQEAGRQASHHA